MTRPDLLALAERVERADGPSFALDGEVWCAVNGYEFIGWDGAGCSHYRPGSRERRHASHHDVKPYTYSVDAVMTLMQEGWSWEVRRSGFGEPAQAAIWDPMKSPGNDLARVTLRSGVPALALLAAILRAIAAMEEA